jgi:hypothetical protein
LKFLYTTEIIKSYTRKIYANRGELIEVIIEAHDNVWIVELKGNRFPCNPSKLSETKPEEIEIEIIKPIDLFNQI